MTLDNRIQTTVAKEIKEGKFSGSWKVEQTNEIPHISGSINLRGFNRIIIGYNPEYEQVRRGQLVIMARDVARHEINHRRYWGFNGCPRNLEYHIEKIYGPIAEALAPKGFNETDAHYLANAFEDSILHADLGGRFSLDGITEFFSNVGRNMSEEQYSAFYDAHVKLNMFLWGNKKQKKRVAEYFIHDKEKQKQIAGIVQGFLRKSGLAGLGRDRDRIRALLNDENNWETIARAYAEEFSQLMEPNYALPIINHSGRGTKGRESEKQKGMVEGNEFDREMEKEEYKIRRIQRAYKLGDKIPPLMESFEALDLLYQSIARQLKLRIENYTETEQRPVFWFGERSFDPDRDNLRHLTFGFDDGGEVELKKRTHAETMNIPHKISPRGFPETRFCLLDTSGSMKYNTDNEHDNRGSPINIGKTGAIPWGDNSKYHYALLGWYGLLEYLKQNHLLNQTTIGLGNVSSETRIARGLEESKREALSPQFGGTVIEDSKIKDIFRGRRSLIYTISDGDIFNWEDIKDKFIKGAREHHYFHLQIGPKNKMTEDLEKNSLKVIEIRNGEDLANKVIEITDSSFRRQ